MAVFLSVLGLQDKAAALLNLVRDGDSHRGSYGRRIVVDTSDLASLPGGVFAYWLPEGLRKWFGASASIGSSVEAARIGLGTLDDFRFLRCWWETRDEGSWKPFVKASSPGPWYSDLHMVVGWGLDGEELKAFVAQKVGSASRKIQSQEFYFRPGLGWSRRPNQRGWFRFIPSGAIPSDNGPMAFAERWWIERAVAVLNSDVAESLMKALISRGYGGSGQTLTYEVGIVESLPLPSSPLPESLADLARQGWSLRRSLDTANEVSHAYVMPGILQMPSGSFDERVEAWAENVARVADEIGLVQGKNDELCFAMYEVSLDDRQAIAEGLIGVPRDEVDEPGQRSQDDDETNEDVDLDPTGMARRLVSWAVGVAVGRFDMRLVTGDRGRPNEPDPFDPLPSRSPAMLNGDVASHVLEQIGTPVEGSPILVDDPGHPLDMARRVRSVFDGVFGQDADRWWTDVGSALGAKDGEAASWLSKGFFDYHLKVHSQSRRKAPLLWPIGTQSGSYLVWLYAHAASADSLFVILNDFVAPKLSTEERTLTQLRQESGQTPTASERKVIDGQEQFVGELRELREELEIVAPLWAPDLDDGIVIALAPLWHVFAHHRAWSIELKKHWEKLTKGDYDWTRLALHLWPERVVPKCAEDRSLAIAHGLEGVFWVKDASNKDKWNGREVPTTPIAELVSNRANPAVSAALERMVIE